jgi:hypothetical protein
MHVNPAIWEAEIGRITVHCQLGQKLAISSNKLTLVAQTCHLSCTGGINRRIEVQASPGKNMRPY